MCLSVFIKSFKQKSLIFLLLLGVLSILHSVCSFHILDLIIPFIINFEFLYLAENNQYWIGCFNNLQKNKSPAKKYVYYIQAAEWTGFKIT